MTELAARRRAAFTFEELEQTLRIVERQLDQFQWSHDDYRIIQLSTFFSSTY
jgi:hypothetical protein